MPHKPTTRKEISRLEHKKARAAARQALDGGHADAVHGMGWGSNLPQPPLLDEESRRYPSRRKGCKRNRKGNGKHEAVPRTEAQRRYYEINGHRYFWGSSYVCKHCGKAMWNHRPPEPVVAEGTHAPDHWTYENIWARLHGTPDSCRCSSCNPR